MILKNQQETLLANFDKSTSQICTLHGPLFLIGSKRSFICTTIYHLIIYTVAFVTPGNMMQLCGRAFAHVVMGRHRSIMVYPLSYFSFQPVHHDWCNTGHGMCYPVCGKVHTKEPCCRKSRPCGHLAI